MEKSSLIRRIGASAIRIAIGVGVGLLILNLLHVVVLKQATSKEYFTVEKRTANFVVHGAAGSQKAVEEYADFLEGFLIYLNREYMVFNYNYPMQVYIWSDEEAYGKVALLAGVPGAAGFYSPRTKAFYTCQGTGYGTLTHEMMHPLLQANLPDLPAWAEEGLPTFFEKFFGYWEDGEMCISTGYQNAWRIDSLGSELTHLDLKKIVRNAPRDQSQLRLASVFLAKHGILKEYMNLVKDKNKKGFDTYYEAAFGKSFAELEPLWQKYLLNIDRHRSQIAVIPGSEVLPNKNEYDRFAAKYNLLEAKDY
jgi:hypothetical protein